MNEERREIWDIEIVRIPRRALIGIVVACFVVAFGATVCRVDVTETRRDEVRESSCYTLIFLSGGSDHPPWSEPPPPKWTIHHNTIWVERVWVYGLVTDAYGAWDSYSPSIGSVR